MKADIPKCRKMSLGAISRFSTNVELTQSGLDQIRKYHSSHYLFIFLRVQELCSSGANFCSMFQKLTSNFPDFFRYSVLLKTIHSPIPSGSFFPLRSWQVNLTSAMEWDYLFNLLFSSNNRFGFQWERTLSGTNAAIWRNFLDCGSSRSKEFGGYTLYYLSTWAWSSSWDIVNDHYI